MIEVKVDGGEMVGQSEIAEGAEAAAETTEVLRRTEGGHKGAHLSDGMALSMLREREVSPLFRTKSAYASEMVPSSAVPANRVTPSLMTTCASLTRGGSSPM